MCVGELSFGSYFLLLRPVAVLSLLSSSRGVSGLVTVSSLLSMPEPKLSPPRLSLVESQRSLRWPPLGFRPERGE